MLLTSVVVAAPTGAQDPNYDVLQIGGALVGESGEFAGMSIALSGSGTIVAVGAPGDDDGSPIGTVRVYRWTGTSWQQLGGTLSGGVGDRFGEAVALSANGEVLVVGAPDASNTGENQGFAEALVWDGTTWTTIGRRIYGLAGDFFGSSVDVTADGGFLAVGAPGNEGGTGDASVLRWNGQNWDFLDVVPGVDPNGGFGHAVAISDDAGTLVVGAPNAGEGNEGTAEVFDWNVSQYDRVGAGFIGTDSGDGFGFSVDVSGDRDTVAIGAPNASPNGTDSGEAYVLERAPSGFQLTGGVIEGQAGDFLGVDVALSASGDTVAVGAPGFVEPRVGEGSGKVETFTLAGGVWAIVDGYVYGEFAFDFLGASVAISADGEDFAMGSPGSQGNGADAGAGFVFRAVPPGTLLCNNLPVTVDLAANQRPTEGPDVIRGTSGPDVINGLGGGDIICGQQGNDRIDGGAGFDKIFAGAGNDIVNGDGGNDRLVGGAGNDTLNGGDGVDRIQGGPGADQLNGGNGNDRLLGSSGNDTLDGGDGNDELFGHLGRDELRGGTGDDVLRGGAWLDSFDGGPGDNDGCTLTDPTGLNEPRVNCEGGVFGR